MKKPPVKRRIVIWFFILLIPFSMGLIILFSPFGKHDGFDYRLVKHTVHIDAPVENVFSFLGNSGNAARWSVFVDHISPLNADTVIDGAVGSKRRCYCHPDEKGTQWDELITEVIPGQKRQLTIYNMQGFTLSEEGLATEQLYHPLGSKATRLTFTVFYKDRKPGLSALLKTYVAAYRIKSIFRENMNNIKQLVEAENRQLF